MLHLLESPKLGSQIDSFFFNPFYSRHPHFSTPPTPWPSSDAWSLITQSSRDRERENPRSSSSGIADFSFSLYYLIELSLGTSSFFFDPHRLDNISSWPSPQSPSPPRRGAPCCCIPALGRRSGCLLPCIPLLRSSHQRRRRCRRRHHSLRAFRCRRVHRRRRHRRRHQQQRQQRPPPPPLPRPPPPLRRPTSQPARPSPSTRPCSPRLGGSPFPSASPRASSARSSASAGGRSSCPSSRRRARRSRSGC